MKKITNFLLMTLLFVSTLISTVGCSSGQINVTYSPEITTGDVDDYTKYLGVEFNNLKSLSNSQGYENWYYYCGDPEDDTLSLMIFNDFYGRWCSRYQSMYYFSYIWDNSWLPENEQGLGIGMGFKAPATGKIHVVTRVKLLAEPQYNTGDGVVLTISDKRGDPYDGISITPEDGDKEFVLENTIDIKMGEEVLFMLFPNSSNQNDYTSVDITINYE